MSDLRNAWLSTRLVVFREGDPIDLDQVDTGTLSDALAPFVPPICVVTAWNPMGHARSLVQNEAANLRLQADLDAKGRTHLMAIGEAVDASWAERGFALDNMTETEARALGREWGQLAVFYVTEEHVRVLNCDSQTTAVRRRGEIAGGQREGDPPFVDILMPNDPDQYDWLLPVALYYETSLLNDGTRTAAGRLADGLADQTLANIKAGLATRFESFAALCPWTDLRDSEWLRLARLVGEAAEEVTTDAWNTIMHTFRAALIQFDAEFPNATKRTRTDDSGD